MIQLEQQLREWLAEDIGYGDVTSMSCLAPDVSVTATMVAKATGVLAGVEAAMLCFAIIQPEVEIDFGRMSGEGLEPGDVIAEIEGSAAPLLSAERVALNLVQHLSGIATLTAAFVAAVEHTDAIILDTRKTTPGLRLLEKQAVLAGGGNNHRFGLFDGLLIKDNHIIAAGGIAAAIQAARSHAPHTLRVEVEVETLAQVKEALAAGAEVLLLDNMPLDLLRQAVMLADSEGVWTEASGGVTLQTVGAIAETGVDAISVGALTHSAPALDISLDLSLD